MTGKIASPLFVLLVASVVLLTPHEPVYAATATYTYDGAGRLIRVEYGTGRGFTYQYDNAGNLTARTALVPAIPTRRRSVRSASSGPASKEKPAAVSSSVNSSRSADAGQHAKQ